LEKETQNRIDANNAGKYQHQKHHVV